MQRSSFTTINFKQFRDGERTRSACYQALLQSDFDATNIVDLQPLPPAEVILTEAMSLPIISSLGLAGTNLAPIWEYSLRCDLTFGNTRTIFEAE